MQKLLAIIGKRDTRLARLSAELERATAARAQTDRSTAHGSAAPTGAHTPARGAAGQNADPTTGRRAAGAPTGRRKRSKRPDFQRPLREGGARFKALRRRYLPDFRAVASACGSPVRFTQMAVHEIRRALAPKKGERMDSRLPFEKLFEACAADAQLLRKMQVRCRIRRSAVGMTMSSATVGLAALV